MRFTLRFLLPVLLLASAARGQDCIVGFSFTNVGNFPTAGYNNQTQGCTTWVLTYNSNGFSALSLQVDSAADAGNVAGAFGAFAGTVVPGVGTAVNPNTATNQGQTIFTGYFPWIRVRLVSKTGTGSILGVLQGFKTPPVGVTNTTGNTTVVGAAATGAAPSGNPVYVAGLDGNGNIIAPTFCTLSAPVSLSASGLTQIVALGASKLIRICQIELNFASAVDFQLQQGTGANCGTGTANVTGVYKTVTGVNIEPPAGVTLNTASGQALCANLGAAVTGGGHILYALY